jgi:hypothetical protein
MDCKRPSFCIFRCLCRKIAIKKAYSIDDKTLLMVEDYLKCANVLAAKKEIIKNLGIINLELTFILEYLKDKGKIIDGKKGILWIYNPSKRLKLAIKDGEGIG